MLKKCFFIVVVAITLGWSLFLHGAEVTVDQNSATPGGIISVKGEHAQLYEGSIKMGDNFLDLVKGTDIDFPFHNRVTIVSIVPSIDTSVCELQTHRLGTSKKVFPDIDIVTISRDLPMAQNRFAKEAKLKKIQFVSDYKTGSFGKKFGLMIKGKELLTRAVFVINGEGIVRYIQVVPELSHLPDISKAIEEANSLVSKKNLSKSN